MNVNYIFQFPYLNKILLSDVLRGKWRGIY